MNRGVRRRLARAMACHRTGRLAEAERLYGAVVERAPDNADAWHLLGCLAQQRGEGMAAAARVIEAIRRQPENPAFHCTLGDILAAQGMTRQATLCYREALQAEPGFLPALVNLGNALQRLGKYREACVAYWHAIENHPDCADAYSNLGNALRGDGRAEESLACYREALRLAPDSPEAAINLAGALVQLNQPREAGEWARRAVALRPESSAALDNLAMALAAAGDWAEAERCAREALARAPLAAHLHSNLGSILLRQRRYAEAEAVLERALELRPDSAATHNAAGAALAAQGRLQEGEVECLRAVQLSRSFADGWTELGLIRQGLGRNPEGLACLDQAVRLQPAHARARLARAAALLAAGRFGEGFAEYEWRWQSLPARPRACERPTWNGSDLSGKTILLSSEQGLGDTIQFARYAPLVAARGGRVLVEAPETLRPLLRTVPGVAHLITPAMPLPDFDEQAPLASLPRILGTTLETIPAEVPYLRADQSLAERMADALGPRRRTEKSLRVGLAWTGNPAHPRDRYRSLRLARLEEFGRLAGVEWYSLHIGEKERAEAEAAGWVRQILSQSGGVAELAALMTQLDLVVSVDSMPAHLAGALGRPVWTLLALAADWRWLLERADTPWYPTMRLFRQQRLGDWEGVGAEVCRVLREGAVQVPPVRADEHS